MTFTNLFAIFADVTSAVADATSEARNEARYEGRKVGCPFVRSRGKFLLALKEDGQRVFDEPQQWGGTKGELVKFIAEAQAAGAEEVVVDGGYDWSDTFDFYDYEPWATSWQVKVWQSYYLDIRELNVDIEIASLSNLPSFARRLVREAVTLDDAAARIRAEYPNLFVYRAGSHVAVHPASGDPNRLLLIAEAGVR